MSVEIRRLRKGEIDHERLWLLVGAGSLVCAWLWRKLQMPWPQCVFLNFTGLPCPTCGATRCLLLLSRGQLRAAFWMNPLAFCTLIAVALFAVYATAVLLLRLPRIRLSPGFPAARAVRFLVVAALAANWIYLIVVGRS